MEATTKPADHGLARQAIGRRIVSTGIAELVTHDTPDAFEVRRRSPRSDPAYPQMRHPKPLEGIRAARFLARIAAGEVRTLAAEARGHGMTWTQIGEALGYADRPLLYVDGARMTPAEAAWKLATTGLEPDMPYPPRLHGHAPAVSWDCWSCGQRVSETGIEQIPGESQRGHGFGCEQLAAEVAAADAAWNASIDG